LTVSSKGDGLGWYQQRKKDARCVTWKCKHPSLPGRARCAYCLKDAASKVQRVRVPETMLAYLAGIVDGEGCIAVVRYAYKSRRTGKRIWAYALSVVVVNTHRPLLRLFKKYFLGSIHPRTRYRKRKPCFSWHIAHQAGRAFLIRLLPYLREKRKQAVLAIRCQAMNDRQVTFKRKALLRVRQEKLRIKIKELKRV
jgi:hypothetical protein